MQVVIDLKEYRAFPTHLLCKRGDRVEFKSAHPSLVIKPYLEVLDLNTKQVVFTADSLRQDTPTCFVVQSLGRFEYRSEVFPFVKGVMEVVDQEQSGQPSEKRPQPGAKQEGASSGAHTGDDSHASSMAAAEVTSVQEQEQHAEDAHQQQQKQQQQQKGQGQSVDMGQRGAEEGMHQRQPDAALQLPPRAPPIPQQQQQQQHSGTVGLTGREGEQHDNLTQAPPPQQHQEQQHVLCASAASAATHERKQHRVSMSEQVDVEDTRRESTTYSALGGSSRTRRVSFSEHALLQESLSGRERDFGERLSERPSETNSATSEYSRGRRGSRSRRSSGSRGHTDGEDGGQFHGMDEEAFQHASLAAAAAAAAMPQLTKLALEHKQRRASASESSVLSPFASEANSTTTGFVPRNREAADLGLLTELASQAAVSAICSPRTRASSRRASRGASSNGSMTPSHLESSFAAGHFRAHTGDLSCGTQSSSKCVSEPNACDSENEDGSRRSRSVTRHSTFNEQHLAATQGAADFQGASNSSTRVSMPRRRSLMSMSSTHAGDADLHGFNLDTAVHPPKSADTLSTTAYTPPSQPNPMAESHLQHGGTNRGHYPPMGQLDAAGFSNPSAASHLPHNPRRSHPMPQAAHPGLKGPPTQHHQQHAPPLQPPHHHHHHHHHHPLDTLSPPPASYTSADAFGPSADGWPQNPGSIVHGVPVSDSHTSTDASSSHHQHSSGMYGALTHPHRSSTPSAWGREVAATAQQQQHHHHPQLHPHAHYPHYPHPPPGKYLHHPTPIPQLHSPLNSSSNVSSRSDSPAAPPPPPSRPANHLHSRPSPGMGFSPHQHQATHGGPPSAPSPHPLSAFATQYQPSASPFSMSPRASYDSSCRASPPPGGMGARGAGMHQGGHMHSGVKASQGGHSSSSSTFHSVVSSRRGSQSVHISPGNSMTLAEGTPAVQAQDNVVPVPPGGRATQQHTPPPHQYPHQHPHQHPHNYSHQHQQPHAGPQDTEALPYGNTGNAFAPGGASRFSHTGPPSSGANSYASSGSYRSTPHASSSQLVPPPPPPPPPPPQHAQAGASVSRHTTQHGNSEFGRSPGTQHTYHSGPTAPSSGATSTAHGVPTAPPASSAFHHSLEGPARRASSGPSTVRPSLMPPPPPQSSIGTPYAVPAAPVALPATQAAPNVRQQQQQLTGHHAGGAPHEQPGHQPVHTASPGPTPNPLSHTPSAQAHQGASTKHQQPGVLGSGGGSASVGAGAHAAGHPAPAPTSTTKTSNVAVRAGAAPPSPVPAPASTAPRGASASPVGGSGGPLALPVVGGPAEGSGSSSRTVQPSTAARPSTTAALPRTPCQICNKPYIAALNAKRCAAQHEGVSRVLAKGVPFTDAWAERCKEYGWAELREWWQACPVKRTREVFGLLATVLSGAHALRGEPSPDTVMKVVQNYRDMRVSMTSSNVADYARAGMALMQWMDSRASGQPPVFFKELHKALQEATEGTAFGLPFGVERSMSLGNKPLGPTASLHVPSCGEACLAYLIELWAGQLMDDQRQQQRVFLEERLTEEAWSGQAMELLLSFDMYKGNSRHVDALFKMMQAPGSFLDGMPADAMALQAVGCLVPAPLRVRWQHLVSQTKQQQQLPPTQPGQSKPEQILAPPPSAAQAAQQPPAPTTAQAANTNSHTDPNTTAPTPAAPPVAAPVAATAASTGVGEGGSRRTKGTAAPSDTSPSMAPVHTHPTPHPNAVSASHVQQQQHPSSSTANTTNTTPASAAPATTTAKSSNQRANHVLAQLAAAPPIIPSRLMHHSGSGSSAKAVQARTVLPHTVGVGHQRVGMPLTVGRPQQATAGAQQQLRCPVCATKHSSGINLARCEVRHRGGEAANSGGFYMTASGRRFIPGWRGVTSALGGRTLLPIKEQTQQLAKEDMRPRQQRMREAMASQWEQLLASAPHKALRLQGLVPLTGALPSEEQSPMAIKWATKWAKVLEWTQQVLLAPDQAAGASTESTSLLEHILRARTALGIQRDGTRVSRESNTAETMAQQALVGFDKLWEALHKASGGMCLTSAQFRAEDVYASIHLDSAAGSQVMRGVRGEAGAAETASSVLAVMLELELRGALDVERAARTQAGSSRAQDAPQPSPAPGTTGTDAAPASSTSAEQVESHGSNDKGALPGGAAAAATLAAAEGGSAGEGGASAPAVHAVPAAAAAAEPSTATVPVAAAVPVAATSVPPTEAERNPLHLAQEEVDANVLQPLHENRHAFPDRNLRDTDDARERKQAADGVLRQTAVAVSRTGGETPSFDPAHSSSTAHHAKPASRSDAVSKTAAAPAAGAAPPTPPVAAPAEGPGVPVTAAAAPAVAEGTPAAAPRTAAAAAAAAAAATAAPASAHARSSHPPAQAAAAAAAPAAPVLPDVRVETHGQAPRTKGGASEAQPTASSAAPAQQQQQQQQQQQTAPPPVPGLAMRMLATSGSPIPSANDLQQQQQRQQRRRQQQQQPSRQAMQGGWKAMPQGEELGEETDEFGVPSPVKHALNFMRDPEGSATQRGQHVLPHAQPGIARHQQQHHHQQYGSPRHRQQHQHQQQHYPAQGSGGGGPGVSGGVGAQVPPPRQWAGQSGPAPGGPHPPTPLMPHGMMHTHPGAGAPMPAAYPPPTLHPMHPQPPMVSQPQPPYAAMVPTPAPPMMPHPQPPHMAASAAAAAAAGGPMAASMGIPAAPMPYPPPPSLSAPMHPPTGMPYYPMGHPSMPMAPAMYPMPMPSAPLAASPYGPPMMPMQVPLMPGMPMQPAAAPPHMMQQAPPPPYMPPSRIAGQPPHPAAAMSPTQGSMAPPAMPHPGGPPHPQQQHHYHHHHGPWGNRRAGGPAGPPSSSGPGGPAGANRRPSSASQIHSSHDRPERPLPPPSVGGVGPFLGGPGASLPFARGAQHNSSGGGSGTGVGGERFSPSYPGAPTGQHQRGSKPISRVPSGGNITGSAHGTTPGRTIVGYYVCGEKEEDGCFVLVAQRQVGRVITHAVCVQGTPWLSVCGVVVVWFRGQKMAAWSSSQSGRLGVCARGFCACFNVPVLML